MTKRLLSLAAGIGCTLLHLSVAAQSSTNLIALNTTAPVYTGVAISEASVESVHFCGEDVPTRYPAVTERWTRTLDRQAALAGHLALLKRRASVIFPVIEPILKQYRIPTDFKFLPLLESALTNRAVSRRGAAGFWQIMPQTAQSLGLQVSHRQDERYNLRKATHAICRYINELYDQLGSWMLVATAYNAGPNYIQQLTRQYPDMHPMALPYRAPETKAYLFQAVAVKELLTRPQVYRDRLSNNHLAMLSSDAVASATERAEILASFDLDETTWATAVQANETSLPAFVADSTTTVVLLTEEEPAESSQTESTTPTAKANEVKPVADVARLVTRSLSEGPVQEGQLCIFQVVQPVTINGRPFGLNDIIQAHVEIVDKSSGRVYLRTDRVTNAQTQETVSLTLVATEQARQPGVALPGRLNDWRISWEAL